MPASTPPAAASTGRGGRIGRAGAGRVSGQNRLPVSKAALFLAPALVLYALFVLYPIVQSLRYSLYDWNGLEPLGNFAGLDNFKRAFDDQLFRDALRHNVIIIVLSLVVQIPCALALALLLNAHLPGRAALRT